MNLIQKTSLRDEAANVLREWIVDGRLTGGEALRESKLSKELGVSRTPLREALLGLEREGFVRSEINRGFTVAEIDVDVIVELYPIVGSLEALALRLTGPELKNRCGELTKLNNEIKRAKKSTEELYELDLEFHEILWKSCPNKRLVQMLSKLKLHIARFDGARERGVADIQNSCEQHAAIIAAIEQGKYADAALEDEEHWRFGTNTVLKWIKNNRESAE